MWAYLRMTLRVARRMPILGLFAGLGLAAVAVGLGLGIYALSSDPAANARLAQESVVGTAALAALWLLARTLEGDSRSGFCVAADQTAAGVVARLSGRWAGAVVVGLLCALPAAAASCAWAGSDLTLLLLTTSCGAGLCAAWALLLGGFGAGSVGICCGVGLLWVAGHLPWGSPGWGGSWAAGMAALLPPGSAVEGGLRAGAPAALLGLVGVALALARPRGAGRVARPRTPAARA